MVFLCPSMGQPWPQPLRVSSLWRVLSLGPESPSSKGSPGCPCCSTSGMPLPCCGLSVTAVPERYPSIMECLLPRMYLQPCPQQPLSLHVSSPMSPRTPPRVFHAPHDCSFFINMSELGCGVLPWRAAVLNTWWAARIRFRADWTCLWLSQLVAASHTHTLQVPATQTLAIMP